MPTVVQNAAGDTIYLIYLVRTGGPLGLYAHRFDTETRTWEPAQFFPGSEEASYISAGPVNRFPETVDRDGNVTILWQTVDVDSHGLYASRAENGVWQAAHELLVAQARMRWTSLTSETWTRARVATSLA